MAAWHPGFFEPPDRGLAERARARICNGALYSPPRYGDEVEQLAGDAAETQPRGQDGEHLGRAAARVELQAVRLVEAEQHPHLVSREHGQIGARDEHGRGDDPVLPGERRDEPLADRAA